jgi:hypothetical protein
MVGDLVVNPTPPPYIHLCRAQAFVHVEEYIWTICALVLSTPTTSSNETTSVYHFLHPFVDVDYFILRW